MSANVPASSNGVYVPEHRRPLAARPQLWLALMLFALHGALAWGIEIWWARVLLLAHVALFLVWQPTWRGERSLESRQVFLVVVIGLLLAAWSSWWLMAIWIGVLFALLGGNVSGSQHRLQRLAALLAATYLLALLLVWIVPHLFVDQSFEEALVLMVRYALPVLPLVIALLPLEATPRSNPLAVDLFYSLLLFLLVCALVLGSFVIKQVSNDEYPLALAETLLGIAVVLIGLSWLWNPSSGFVGMGHLLSRYLLSLGLPFERWVQGIAEVAESESRPETFIDTALANMRELPWVAGATWRTPRGGGSVGTHSRFAATQTFRDLELTFYTRWSLAPALLLHLKLLTQILGHFYEAKRREQLQRQNAYTQAIYDTGARLTHDVKNLLQSLKSLCAAAESSSPAEGDALNALIRRQLPQVTQRLSNTLEKLSAPQHETATSQVAASVWWENLKQRHTSATVTFEEESAVDGQIPGELFDSVAENLLANAFAKSQHENDLVTAVQFDAREGGQLTICDSGAAIPFDVAATLLQTPVASQTGLGIGLYQAALHAERLGYRLHLVDNEHGRVCFRLAAASRGQPVTAAGRP